MNGLLALTVLFLIFGIGDIISSKTKAIVSTMFVSSVVLMVGFWVGLPKTIFQDSAMLAMGSILISILIVHMGTIMNVNDIVKQWKTVLIALGAIVGVGVFVYLVGTPILGREYAVAAAPPIAGGVVAGIIMGEAAGAKGLESIMVFTTLLVVVQGFFGYPIASICLRKEAKRVLKEGKYKELSENNKAVAEMASTVAAAVQPKKKMIPALPKDLQTSSILLAKLGLGGVLSAQIAKFTGINAYVVCLFVGLALKELGFLEEDALTKSNSAGFSMGALMVVIYSSLVKATPEMIGQLAAPLFISLTLGAIGIALVSIPVGKLLGYSWYMSLAIGVTALFGFPGTFIISNEVANAEGKTQEERKAILDEILPKMLISGFVTVTIASVLLAGFMVKMM